MSSPGEPDGLLVESRSALLGSMMAGRTEEGVGEPETVALQTSILTSDLLDALS